VGLEGIDVDGGDNLGEDRFFGDAAFAGDLLVAVKENQAAVLGEGSIDALPVLAARGENLRLGQPRDGFRGVGLGTLLEKELTAL